MTRRRRGEGRERELRSLSLHCLVFLILYFGAFGNVSGSGSVIETTVARLSLLHTYIKKGVVSRRGLSMKREQGFGISQRSPRPGQLLPRGASSKLDGCPGRILRVAHLFPWEGLPCIGS